MLSGAVAALEEAETALRERGVRAKRLPVAGAFHSPLMEPAVEPFRALVAETEVHEPRVPVLSCVTAEPFDDIGLRRPTLDDVFISLTGHAAEADEAADGTAGTKETSTP